MMEVYSKIPVPKKSNGLPFSAHVKIVEEYLKTLYSTSGQSNTKAFDASKEGIYFNLESYIFNVSARKMAQRLHSEKHNFPNSILKVMPDNVADDIGLAQQSKITNRDLCTISRVLETCKDI